MDNIIDNLNQIYPVSRETFSKLAQYKLLLEQWQKKTNLVAPSTLEQFWSRHVADSLQLIKLSPETTYWTDIGSGGGFPGLVIGMMMAEKAKADEVEANVNLIESIQKKCAFLRRVSLETQSPAHVFPIRIESASKQLSEASVITARALASLDRLLSLTDGHICGSRKALFHKGRDYLKEIEECRGKWTFDLIIHPSVIDPESVVLELSNVSAKI